MGIVGSSAADGNPVRPSSSSSDSIRDAWARRAGDLARWAWTWLVNRVDVWGGYTPLELRGKEYTRPDGTVGKTPKTVTRPSKDKRGRIALSESVLLRHFRGMAVEDVVGLHTTNPENTSRWGAVEVDQHGEGGNDPAANLAASLAWFDQLRGMGFHPLLTDSNGAGGYHLLTIFARPVPTPRVYAFLRTLTADHARYGIPARPEAFPKQPGVAPPGQNGQFGNWLRLPGRHHTREHWSRVWDGSAWLEGEPAIDFILTLTGDRSGLLPEESQRVTVPPVGRARYISARPRAGADGLDRCIPAYLARLPNLGEGQGRDDVAFGFAAFLVRDLALPDHTALDWLERWDAGNHPSKGRERLLEIIASAHKYGRRPYGSGLRSTSPPPRHRGHAITMITVEVR